MEYKKAYEEALERAKGIYNENPSSSTAKFVCGQIFPELNESEDERIRKEIINYLSNELHNVKQLTPRTNEFEDWIAYLEKQKAQRPAEWSDAERKKLYCDGYDSSRKNLALDFMHYIDENRPEGKMGLSNGECAALMNAFKVGDVETIVRYINKYQQPAEWLKAIHPHPAKSTLAEGVYYIKDGKPVAEYKDGVETDRLLIIGKYCRFYISMADLGTGRFAEAQKKSESLGEGWRCPDSFEGRTIGKMSDEIREKAAKIGAEHFEKKGWFWTNEVFDRWYASNVYSSNGSVYNDSMTNTHYVLALSAFQN